MQLRLPVHRSSHNFSHQQETYRSLDEKYRGLETELSAFKHKASQDLDDIKHLYVTETSRLHKIIKDQKHTLPTEIVLLEPSESASLQGKKCLNPG